MAYIINLYEYSDIETHWVGLHMNNDKVTYFEIKSCIRNKNIKQTFLEYKHTVQ